MKQKIFTMAATLGVLLGLAVVAGAQTRGTVRASIRFDFVAGEKRMLAGDYTVRRMSANTFILRRDDGKESAMVLAPVSMRQRQEGSPERLVFTKIGGQYFLTQLWTDRRADGRALNRAKADERLAKETDSAPRVIEVLAKSN
jgi:hypothetical protein